MRKALAVILMGGLTAAPVLAQTTDTSTPKTTHKATGPGAPVDYGPFTPQANAAYQGGGMILQGAPGAPPPTPEATPPGQTPKNMVPP